MSADTSTKDSPARLPNGPGAAAILAAGIGSAVLGVLSLASDALPAVSHFFGFVPASGDLSGVTTTAVVVWLLAWFVIARRWAGRNVGMAGVTLASFVLLFAGFLFTFPPFMDFLQGK